MSFSSLFLHLFCILPFCILFATTVITKANAVVTVNGYSGVYDSAFHGATGSVVGVDAGGAASGSSLNLSASFKDVPGGTAHWVFTGGTNYNDQSGDAAIVITAKHITGSFTAANKVYDGNTSATVLSRSLSGAISGDGVALVGGTATFSDANAGINKTVTLSGATLSGGDAGNYVLDSVTSSTANITPKALGIDSASTQSALNVAKDGAVSLKIDVNESGIVDAQTVASLFNGVWFTLSVNGNTYSVKSQAVVLGGMIHVKFLMTAELQAILAAETTATSANNAPIVALRVTATSIGGNYTLDASALTRLCNSIK